MTSAPAAARDHRNRKQNVLNPNSAPVQRNCCVLTRCLPFLNGTLSEIIQRCAKISAWNIGGAALSPGSEYLAAAIILLLSTPVQIASAQDSGNPDSDPSEKARLLLSQLTPEERVGQLFLVTFDGAAVSPDLPIYDLIHNHHVGGIILLAKKDNILPLNSNPTVRTRTGVKPLSIAAGNRMGCLHRQPDQPIIRVKFPAELYPFIHLDHPGR